MAANSSRRLAAPHWQRASVGRGEGPYARLWIHPSEVLPPAFQDVLCRRCRAYAVGLGPRDPSVTQKLTSSQLEHKNCGNASIRPLEEKGANSKWGVWEVNLQNPEYQVAFPRASLGVFVLKGVLLAEKQGRTRVHLGKEGEADLGVCVQYSRVQLRSWRCDRKPWRASR